MAITLKANVRWGGVDYAPGATIPGLTPSDEAGLVSSNRAEWVGTPSTTSNAAVPATATTSPGGGVVLAGMPEPLLFDVAAGALRAKSNRKNQPLPPIYANDFSAAPLGTISSIRATAGLIDADSDSTLVPLVRAGRKSFKITASEDDPAYTARWGLPNLDVRSCDFRLRYYVNNTAELKSNINRLRLRLYSTYPSGDALIQLPAAPGWNDVEFSLSAFVPGSSFDPTARADMFAVTFGVSNPDNFKSGDYVVLDLFEIRPTGRQKAAIQIWLDDGYKCQFDEMIPYAQAKGVPIWVGVSPEKMGGSHNAGGAYTQPVLNYASWEQVQAAHQTGDVLVGTHSMAADAMNSSADAAVATEMRSRIEPMYLRGITNGLEYYALPGGQAQSLASAVALDEYFKHFSVVRGVAPWYQETPNGFIAPTADPSYTSGSCPLRPVGRFWGSAHQIQISGTLSDYMTQLNHVIACKSHKIFYAHGLSEDSDYFVTTRAAWRGFIDAVAAARNAGQLDIITPQNWYEGSFDLGYTPAINENAISDPGNGNAIPVVTSGFVALATTAAAQTRTLAAPTYRGQRLTLRLGTVSTPGTDTVIVACATTFNSAGNNRATFSAVGQSVEMVGTEVGAELVWRIALNRSVALSTV